MAVSTYCFSTFAFLGFLLVSIPLPWHVRAQNAGTCLYMVWTALGCLNFFINSIVWANNAINWAPVWCDISARIMVGLGIAIPASSLCINRCLFRVASGRSTHLPTKAEKRREIMIDIAISVGCPFIVMALQYIVQGHRFDIIEEFGCSPSIVMVPLAFPLVLMWPAIIGLISLSYGTRAVYYFLKQRSQFKEILATNTNMSPNRYIRLMCLAGIEALCTTPLALYYMIHDASFLYSYHYRGWKDLHVYFSRVDQYPAIIWHSNHAIALAVELNRWAPIGCAFIFFAFFGFTEEARNHYRLAYLSVTKRLCYRKFFRSTGTTRSTDMRPKSLSVTLSPVRNPPIALCKETTRFDSFKLSVTELGSFDLDLEKSLDGSTDTSIHSTNKSPSSAQSNSSITLALPADDNIPEPPAISRPEPSLDISNVFRHSTELSSVRPSRPSSFQLEADVAWLKCIFNPDYT